jgi:hypothetical protein
LGVCTDETCSELEEPTEERVDDEWPCTTGSVRKETEDEPLEETDHKGENYG